MSHILLVLDASANYYEARPPFLSVVGPGGQAPSLKLSSGSLILPVSWLFLSESFYSACMILNGLAIELKVILTLSLCQAITLAVSFYSHPLTLDSQTSLIQCSISSTSTRWL